MQSGVWKIRFVLAASLALAGGCVLDNDEVCGANMVFVAQAASCLCVPHSVEADHSCTMCADDEVATEGVCKPASDCTAEGSCPNAS